ncbi:hypothetical protein AB0I85_29325 [Micromonospora echinofusca]|uniref:hypothetical protein n=1 Tax=Micromonospora echinofusca TaxID=47858 RepID=UPI001182B293
MRPSLLLFVGGALALAQTASGARIVLRDALDAEAMYGGGTDVVLLLMLLVTSVTSAAVLIAAGGLLVRHRLRPGRALLHLSIGPILVRSAYGGFLVSVPNDGGPFPAWAVVTEVVAGPALVLTVIAATWLLFCGPAARGDSTACRPGHGPGPSCAGTWKA